MYVTRIIDLPRPIGAPVLFVTLRRSVADIYAPREQEELAQHNTMAQVGPHAAVETTEVTSISPLKDTLGGIPLDSLNPDLNGDGKIDDWEKEVYARIVAADTDHTGSISVRNLFDFIRSMSNEVKEASKGGIPIASLNPDTDGVCPPQSNLPPLATQNPIFMVRSSISRWSRMERWKGGSSKSSSASSQPMRTRVVPSM